MIISDFINSFFINNKLDFINEITIPERRCCCCYFFFFSPFFGKLIIKEKRVSNFIYKIITAQVVLSANTFIPENADAKCQLSCNNKFIRACFILEWINVKTCKISISYISWFTFYNEFSWIEL